MTKHKKHICCCCGNIAVWENEFNDRRARYYCDNCVPRGSIVNIDNLEDMGEPLQEVNVMWWDKDAQNKDLLKDGSLVRNENSFYYEELDAQGRRQPYDDYLYDENGFEICRFERCYGITYDDIKESVDNSSWTLSYKYLFMLQDEINSIFLVSRLRSERTVANYNKFMSHFGNYLNNKNDTLGTAPIKISTIKDFYMDFKKEIQQKKIEISK
jgi:hypothetical protein